MWLSPWKDVSRSQSTARIVPPKLPGSQQLAKLAKLALYPTAARPAEESFGGTSKLYMKSVPRKSTNKLQFALLYRN